MTVFERRALSPPDASVRRSLAALAGLALMASVALLLHRAAPGAPAIIPLGLASLSGFAALALAFTLEDAARLRFTQTQLTSRQGQTTPYFPASRSANSATVFA